MTGRIDHVAIVVKSLDESLGFYRDALGLHVSRVEDNPAEGVRIAFLPLGDCEIELLEPLTPDPSLTGRGEKGGGGVARFLERRGGGLHHVCIEVPDIEAAMARLLAGGAKMIDDAPRIRPDGIRYAFVHPRSTGGVLLELYEKGQDDKARE
jgi:methylmalonyl-CoA/ethylmalonyl-CoA epimerase